MVKNTDSKVPYDDFTINYSPTITFSNTFTCRWCSMPNENVASMVCRECGASQGIGVWFQDGAGGRAKQIKIYHNPDNSLYFDFVTPRGGVSRYTMSPTELKKLGLLTEFNKDPEGKRTP